MRTAFRSLTTAGLLLLSSCRGESASPDIALEHGWVRSTVAARSSAAAYLTIRNNGDGEDRLVSVSSPAAGAASLHSSSNEGGIARMRPLKDGVVVPPNSSAIFEPGGNHVMLTGLRQPLDAGRSVELRLRFERSGERRIDLRVVDAASAGHGHH